MKNQELQSLEQRVLHFIRENNLISGQRQLLVAVSGGPDSICLLHILVKLREELGLKLHIAHLNHQLRGAESEADARYVSRLAHRLSIPISVESRDVREYRTRKRTSLEEAAREVRYDFLSGVAKSIGTDRVATGHTTDDHVETILMHLLRGTGTRGLIGLRPSSQWHSSENSLIIIRPLLAVSRQEIMDYCHRYRLRPRTDASNYSPSLLRNKIRHQLIPLLENYNPRITEALLRTAHIAGDELAVLNEMGALWWDSIVQKLNGTVILDRGKFLAISAGLQRHLLRRAIEELTGNLKDIEAVHIEGMMDALEKPAGRTIGLPGGLVFVMEYDRYLLTYDSASLCPFPIIKEQVSLKIPGETLLPGWRIIATFVKGEHIEDKENNFTAFLSLSRPDDEVVVRCRQSGDRFQPLGMEQTKKLSDFMIDEKIPAAWRRRIPIVCDTEHILWVVGWRTDERAKVTESTQRVLCLKFERR